MTEKINFEIVQKIRPGQHPPPSCVGIFDTFFGWFIALMSYGPFNSLFYSGYLSYQGEKGWGGWLAGHETLTLIWGSSILILLVMHMWCDGCSGLRFSNLTNRGIITNGMYRFSKHLAYILKSPCFP